MIKKVKILIRFNENSLGYVTPNTVLNSWKRAMASWNNVTNTDDSPFYEYSSSNVSVQIKISANFADFYIPRMTVQLHKLRMVGEIRIGGLHLSQQIY